MSRPYLTFPSTWQPVRLKALVAEVRNGTWGSDLGDGEKGIVCIRAADFDRPTHRLSTAKLVRRTFTKEELLAHSLRRGDLVLEKSGGGVEQPVGEAILFEEPFEAVATNFAARVRPSPIVESRYLWYVLASLYSLGLNRRSINQTTGLQNLDTQSYLNETWAIPSLSTQHQIAAFLDREAARIDALIAAKRRIANLVVERTRVWLADQFDESAARFGLVRLRRLVRGLQQGWSPQCDDRLPEAHEWCVLKAGAVNGGTFHRNERKALPVSETVRAEYMISPGDVLINRANGSLENLGSAALVPEDAPDRTLLCDKLFRVEHQGIDPDGHWLSAMLGAPQVRAFLMLGVSGAEGMANSLPSSVVLNAEIPRADAESQRRFAQSWLRLASTNRKSVDNLRASVALLQEQRQAVVTAAVSGQIDVS